MLLAEIHGKRFPEANGQEDWLTSAVFGNLRWVPPGLFWKDLFARAMNVEVASFSLADELLLAGVDFAGYTNLEMVFWKDCGEYGEPDLLLRFAGSGVAPLVLVIEVKLNSTKSGVGKDDQLTKYLRLLADDRQLPDWWATKDYRYLVYLTRSFAKRELQESVEAYGASAGARMFGLEWTAVLEVAAANAKGKDLLWEVGDFLLRRDFGAFCGFRQGAVPLKVTGRFYGAVYFVTNYELSFMVDREDGRFYGR